MPSVVGTRGEGKKESGRAPSGDLPERERERDREREREREREVGAVREDDSRRDQRVDLSRAERDEELDAVIVRGRGEGDCGFGHRRN